MPYFIALWFFVGSFVVKSNLDETKIERQTVKLFEHTSHSYKSYYVRVDR